MVSVDKIEARQLLEEFIDGLKRQTRDELLRYVRNPDCVTVYGVDGTWYQIEFEAVWDSVPEGDLRIIASIDDGGFFSALRPLSSSFIITREGDIVG
jgi:hypothetical protein